METAPRSERPRRFRVRHGAAVVGLVVVLGYGWTWVDRYGGVPDRPKDCLPRQHGAPPASASVNPVGAPSWHAQTRGTVNDASCLNRTEVYGVVRPTAEGELRTALAFAADNGLKVTFSGTRHSMGGQAAEPGH